MNHRSITKTLCFLSFILFLTACDKLSKSEFICHPKNDSKTLKPYEIVQIHNLQKQICVQYWGDDLTCIPFNGTYSKEDFYDEKTKLILKKTQFTSKVSNSAFIINVTEKWVPSVEVQMIKNENSILFEFKNTYIEIPKRELNLNEIETFKILTLIKHVYDIDIDIGSASYTKYQDRVLGTSILWQYYLDKYTKELSTNGDLTEYGDTYHYKCEKPSDKL